MKRVLVVDDSKLDAIRIEHLLKGTSFEVVAVASGIKEAREIVVGGQIDLVLLDIFLSGNENGLSLLDFLSNRKVDVIVISGSEDMQNYLSVKRFKNFGFLNKPVSKMTLISMLDIVSGRHDQSGSEDLEGKNHIFLKGANNEQLKIYTRDILYLEASQNYCFIITKSKKHIVKLSMKKMLERLDDDFVRISNQHVINVFNLEKYSSSSACVGGNVLKIGGVFKKSFKDYLSKRTD